MQIAFYSNRTPGNWYNLNVWLVSNGEKLWRIYDGSQRWAGGGKGQPIFQHHLATPLVLRVGGDLAVEIHDNDSHYSVEVHLTGRIVTL